MHSVFSPTESQQGCSHPDGEHPIHFSRIKISTAHLTTTLHLHVFLWDDDKWLLRAFFLKDKILRGSASLLPSLQHQSPMNHKIMAASKRMVSSIYLVLQIPNELRWHPFLQEYQNVHTIWYRSLSWCMAAWQVSESVFKEKCLNLTWFLPTRNSSLTFDDVEYIRRQISYYVVELVSVNMFMMHVRDVEWEESRSPMTWFPHR